MSLRAVVNLVRTQENAVSKRCQGTRDGGDHE